jgi:hypothetical protein
MSIVVRAVDVGFGNTKYVTASAQGQVDCAGAVALHGAANALIGRGVRRSSSTEPDRPSLERVAHDGARHLRTTANELQPWLGGAG